MSSHVADSNIQSAANNDSPPAAAATQSAGGGLTINLIPDSTVASAPSGFAAAMQSAAALLEQAFSDAITLNIRYGWGSYDNVVDPSLTGSSGAYAGALNGDLTPYATVKSWLAADSTSTQDASAISSLPANDSFFPNSNDFFVASAQEKALGQFTGNGSDLDGAMAFGT